MKDHSSYDVLLRCLKAKAGTKTSNFDHLSEILSV